MASWLGTIPTEFPKVFYVSINPRYALKPLLICLDIFQKIRNLRCPPPRKPNWQADSLHVSTRRPQKKPTTFLFERSCSYFYLFTSVFARRNPILLFTVEIPAHFELRIQDLKSKKWGVLVSIFKKFLGLTISFYVLPG